MTFEIRSGILPYPFFLLYFSLLTCSFYFLKKDHVQSILNKSVTDLSEKKIIEKNIYFVMAIQFIIYS